MLSHKTCALTTHLISRVFLQLKAGNLDGNRAQDKNKDGVRPFLHGVLFDGATVHEVHQGDLGAKVQEALPEIRPIPGRDHRHQDKALYTTGGCGIFSKEQ